jgi:hypothetical protein
MRGAIPPLPQYAFMVWCLVKPRATLLPPLHVNESWKLRKGTALFSPLLSVKGKGKFVCVL